MSVFFVQKENIENDRIVITGSDVNHIKNVLRYRIGDEIRVTDSAGFVYNCDISSFEPEQINLSIVSKEKSEAELPVKITLFQGLPKADKMELIIQKAVELGVYSIVPVINERSVVKLDPKKATAKTERWQKIAESAAKQSGRAIIPKVYEPMPYKKAFELARNDQMEIILPYENADGMAYAKQVITESVKKGKCGIFIGPEGGFSFDEVELAKEKGTKIISLGHRILRTETAGLFVLSVMGFECETKEKDN